MYLYNIFVINTNIDLPLEGQKPEIETLSEIIEVIKNSEL